MNELKQLCDGLAQSLEELAALLREFPTQAEPQAEPQALPNVDITPDQVNDELVRIANIVPGATELIRGMMTTRQITNLGTATPDQLKDLLHAVRQVEQAHNINKGGQQ